MFTVEQIKTAHSKVKTGADFAAYIQELKYIGVTYYETSLSDGHTDFYEEVITRHQHQPGMMFYM